MDAEHIRAAALESTSALGGLPIFPIVVAHRFDHVPPILVKRQPLAPLRSAIEKGDTFRAKQQADNELLNNAIAALIRQD